MAQTYFISLFLMLSFFFFSKKKKKTNKGTCSVLFCQTYNSGKQWKDLCTRAKCKSDVRGIDFLRKCCFRTQYTWKKLQSHAKLNHQYCWVICRWKVFSLLLTCCSFYQEVNTLLLEVKSPWFNLWLEFKLAWLDTGVSTHHATFSL